MEINVIHEDKDAIEFEVKEETHTFCNILRDELAVMGNVTYAAYSIKHPLVSSPVLVVKTSDGKARKVVEKAVSELKGRVKELRSAVKKL